MKLAHVSHRACIGLTLALAAAGASAQTLEPCGPLKNHYGPLDYRTAQPSQKALVEDFHFNSGVENLTHTMTGYFGGDIGYTLHVFPNHPRALIAMQRLVEKEKNNPPRDARYSIECYYQRALRFQPDDDLVRLLFVDFLLKHNQPTEARSHLAYVVERAPEDPFAQYNAGMLYFDLKDYDKALVQAHKAMAMGLPRKGLKERLMAAGQWAEPAAEAAPAASAPASAAP